MKNKTAILSTVLCLLPLVLSALLYDKLPDQVAIHFDSVGNANGYLPKAAAAFGLPLFLAAVNLFSNFRMATEPRADKAAPFLRGLARWAVPVVSLILMPITLFAATGIEIPIVMICLALVGAVVMICGNYLPKCKRNYSVGIKLPWTLNSDENWNRTHRFAGFVWVVGGFLMVLNAFVQIPWLIAAVFVLLVALPFLYSYLFYRKESHCS